MLHHPIPVAFAAGRQRVQAVAMDGGMWCLDGAVAGGMAIESRAQAFVVPLAQATGRVVGQAGFERAIDDLLVHPVLPDGVVQLDRCQEGADRDPADDGLHVFRILDERVDLAVDLPRRDRDVAGALCGPVHHGVDGAGFLADLLHQRLDVGAGAADLAGQVAHFGGDYGESAASLAGACRFDGGVQCQQIRLIGNFLDVRNQRLDLVCGLVQRLGRPGAGAGVFEHQRGAFVEALDRALGLLEDLVEDGQPLAFLFQHVGAGDHARADLRQHGPAFELAAAHALERGLGRGGARRRQPFPALRAGARLPRAIEDIPVSTYC